MKRRRKWPDIITFFQRISKAEHGTLPPLSVSGSNVQKGEHGSRVYADQEVLGELETIGFLKDLKFVEGRSTRQVSFSFADHNIRNWLRDVGSALELYIYKVCLDTGIFHDVMSSVIVDWDGTIGHDSVSNEIDAVASRGCVPIFISCKACEVRTEAINELAILRDRFGGKGAKGVVVSTEYCNAAARHRAAQLGLAVIDLEEIEAGAAGDRIRIIMKA